MDIGIVGMGVMGRNLAMNFRDRGVKVSVYNRTQSKLELIDGVTKCRTITEFVNSLSRPRKILLMVNDTAVSSIVAEIRKDCDSEDIIVDCGNSHYTQCEQLGIDGCGVSGGEKGARYGPSMMYGGSENNWRAMAPILRKAAARCEEQNIICCDYMGPGGAGHYVKMVHNGIEYSVMQILADIRALGGDLRKIAKIQKSYLLEISESIISKAERFDELKDTVSDKGTGVWCLTEAAKLFPCPILGASVFFRKISAHPKRDGCPRVGQETLKNFDENLYFRAYRAASILAYLEGLNLIATKWPSLSIKNVIDVWKGGCIIRNEILDSLNIDECFLTLVKDDLEGLRELVAAGINSGIAVPGLAAAVESADSWMSTGSAAFLSLMRDFFGSHGVTLKDGTQKHYDWDE